MYFYWLSFHAHQNRNKQTDTTSFLGFFLHPFQDYFSSYEMGQSIGGAKTGEPWETNTWHTRKQNMVFLTCGQSGARTHTCHSGEMIEWLRNSAHNRLATGAAHYYCFTWVDIVETLWWVAFLWFASVSVSTLTLLTAKEISHNNFSTTFRFYKM